MLKLPRHLCKGVTYIETVGVVVVISLLASLAIPKFTAINDRWRVRDATEAMISTLYFARSEALKRGTKIVIQKLPNTPGRCRLASNNQEWGCGWFIFIDSDNNRKYKIGEEILRTVSTPINTDVIHNSGGATISVDHNGKMDGLNAKGFIISPASTGISSPATRGICMAAGGRIKVIEDIPCNP